MCLKSMVAEKGNVPPTAYRVPYRTYSQLGTAYRVPAKGGGEVGGVGQFSVRACVYTSLPGGSRWERTKLHWACLLPAMARVQEVSQRFVALVIYPRFELSTLQGWKTIL